MGPDLTLAIRPATFSVLNSGNSTRSKMQRRLIHLTVSHHLAINKKH